MEECETQPDVKIITNGNKFFIKNSDLILKKKNSKIYYKKCNRKIGINARKQVCECIFRPLPIHCHTKHY